jgi:hypothetical protein
MRARDYDADTGRFLERDPYEGDVQTPETLHPYTFANSNPYYYSDPSGETTIAEFNLVGAMQKSFQGMRGAALQRAKSFALDKVQSALSDLALSRLEHLLPANLGAAFQGLAFEKVVRKAICGALGDPADYFYFEPGINSNGTPLSPGETCDPVSKRAYAIDPPSTRGGLPPGTRYPDMVIGPRPPRIRGDKAIPHTWVLAEVKRSTQTAYNAYIAGRKAKQFDAFAKYAGKHTYGKTLAILIAIESKGHKEGPIAAALNKRAREAGAVGAVVDVIHNGKSGKGGKRR